MLIIFRFLPVLVGAINALLFFAQARHAGLFPWLIVPAPVLLVVAFGFLLWKRHKTTEDLRVILPCLIYLVVSGYGLMLAEGFLALWAIPLIAGFATFIFLELVFLSVFFPARYPVNGLSHVNLSLVPLALWLASFTSVGLTIFMNASRLIPIAVMTGVSLLLFYATSHAESGASVRGRWAGVGAWIGWHIGLLAAVLPLNMIVHGTIAALVGGYALRVRRYGFFPTIPRRLIVTEAIGFLTFFIAVLATSKWV